jgi:hypothetical protein
MTIFENISRRKKTLNNTLVVFQQQQKVVIYIEKNAAVQPEIFPSSLQMQKRFETKSPPAVKLQFQ